jgi:hypothetical protein
MMEIYTLGLNPISIVTELRLQHAQGNKYAGVNVRKVIVFFHLGREPASLGSTPTFRL